MFKVVNKVLDENKKVVAYDVVDEHEISYTLHEGLLIAYLHQGLVENAKVYIKDGIAQVKVSRGYGTRCSADEDTVINYSKTYYTHDGLVLSSVDLANYLRFGLVEAIDPIFIKVNDWYRAVGLVQDYVDTILEHYFYEYIEKNLVWRIRTGEVKAGYAPVSKFGLLKLFPKKFRHQGDYSSVETFVNASTYDIFTDNCHDALYKGIDNVFQRVCEKTGVKIYSLRCDSFIKYYGVSTDCTALLEDFCKELYSEAAISGKDCLTCKGFYKNLDFRVSEDVLHLDVLEFFGFDALDFTTGFNSSVHANEYPYKSVTFGGSCTAFLADLSGDLSEEGITQKLYSKFLFNKSGDSKDVYNVFETFDLILKGGITKDDIVVE